MPVRFRSVVPYTLPGVLALIGWWWYISRKKERITSHDSETEEEEGAAVAMGLLTSPTEGSNGLVERVAVSPTAALAHRTTARDPPPKVRSQRSTEQTVEAQVHVPATKVTPPELQRSLSQTTTPEVASTAPERLDAAPPTAAPHHRPLADAVAETLSDMSEARPMQASPPTTCGQKEIPTVTGPEEYQGSTEHRRPSVTEPEKALVALQPPPQCPPQACLQSTVAVAATAVSQAVCAVAEATLLTQDLTSAERPEPEGEIRWEAPSVHPTASTKDQLARSSPDTPAQTQRTTAAELRIPETPPLSCSSPSSSSQGSLQMVPASTPAPTQSPVPGDSLLFRAPPQQNGGPGAEQLEHLAAGLITEVISAATAQVLAVACCQNATTGLADSSESPAQESRSSSTPLPNGRPCSEQEPRGRDSWPSPIDQESESQEDVAALAVPNGCSPAPAWDATDGRGRERATGTTQQSRWASATSPELQDSSLPSLDELTAAEGESLGSRPLVPCSGPLVPEEAEAAAMAALPEELELGAMCVVKRLNGMGLRNGAHGLSETETDQSGGSDVNSMDSVDSGCTMGAGDSQSSLATSQNSELVVWEIEVPKHLVGRLIGKQGRYVSFLKQSSGAKIYISTLPYTQDIQICHIEGSQEQVDKVLSLIGKKFKDLDLNNLYAPPLTLPSLPMTTWLLLPTGVTVEVIVVNIVSAGHLFVQQHTHPTYHALRSLDQEMFTVYSQPGTPALPSPADVGLICVAPTVEGAWWRAQVISFHKESSEVELRYVDYGGYDRVKIDTLRQIRSDFVTLPFQSAEVYLDNIAALPGDERFSAEATAALEELTRGVALLAQVTNYDNNTGVPLIQMWNMVGEELVSVNRTLAERGLGTWLDSY